MIKKKASRGRNLDLQIAIGDCVQTRNESMTGSVENIIVDSQGGNI